MSEARGRDQSRSAGLSVGSLASRPTISNDRPGNHGWSRSPALSAAAIVGGSGEPARGRSPCPELRGPGMACSSDRSTDGQGPPESSGNRPDLVHIGHVDTAANVPNVHAPEPPAPRSARGLERRGDRVVGHVRSTPVDQIPVVLAQDGQLARLALHRGVPHVRRVDRADQVDFHVVLQHRKSPCAAGSGGRDRRILHSDRSSAPARTRGPRASWWSGAGKCVVNA